VPPHHHDATDRSSFSSICRWFSATQLALILFVLIAPIYAISPQGRPAFYDLKHGGEITRVGLNLAETGSFGDPYQMLPTGPTAHTAPAYVLIFAFIAKVFGIGEAGAIALWLLNVGFLALQLALLPVLSERLGLGILPGFLAAVLGLIVQPYRVLPEWESLFTGALIVSLAVLTLAHFEMPREWQRSALLGFLWGIAILANPECVLLLFAWCIVAMIGSSPERLKSARRATAVVVFGAALACMPWFIRNYERFHSVFFVRDNFGLELSTSNNPCAQPSLLANIESGCHQKTHPNANQALAGEVFDKGEVEFNRAQLNQALAWISSNPRAFAVLTRRRFLKYWFPYLAGLRYAIPTGALTIFSFVGLAIMFRKNRRAAWLIALTLLIYPFVHYFVQFEARYRYPIFWATLLPGAYALIELIDWRRRTSPSQVNVVKEETEMVPVVR
jgi:hypothetical protein